MSHAVVPSPFHYPQLVPEYERLYRGKYPPVEYQRQVQRIAAAVKARVGFRDARAGPAADRPTAASKSTVSQVPVQLSLLPG